MSGHVAVLQPGAQSRRFPPGTQAGHVLLGLTGSAAGTLRNTADGLEYAAAMELHAGEYEVLPAGLQAALGQLSVEDVIKTTATEAATAAVAAVAAQTLQHTQDSTREVLSEVRSWNSSRTVEASRITTADIFVLRRLLHIYLSPYDATDASQVLHPSASDSDFEWDNTPEPSQRQSYMVQIHDNLTPNLSNKLAWKPQTKADLKVKGLGYRVVAKSDELLVAKKWVNVPEAGSVIGIELKKDLTQASRRQGEAEFIAFSLASNFPFLQLVTDMKRGGFAYYKQHDQQGQQVVVEQVLVGMAAFHDFLKAALSDLPSVLTNAHAVVEIVQQLQHPIRTKLNEPFSTLRAAASVYSSDDAPDCGDDALHELRIWFHNKQQLEAVGQLPDALEFLDQAVTQ